MMKVEEVMKGLDETGIRLKLENCRFSELPKAKHNG